MRNRLIAVILCLFGMVAGGGGARYAKCDG